MSTVTHNISNSIGQSDKETYKETYRGLQWCLTERLEEINFTDGLCLMSHKLTNIRENMEELSTKVQKVGSKINLDKTKDMRLSSRN